MLRFSLAVMAGLAAAPSLAADAGHPLVIELFQSQGCSSCPPANANVMAIADRPDILALSWQVTYWDQLGWKDTFARPAFTARQWDYAHGLHHDNVATPQVVVNGRVDGVGIRRAELDQLVRSGDRGDSGPAIRIMADRVVILGLGPNAKVLMVRYDPHVLRVPIGAGENSGVTLPHRNVVRQLAVLGDWRGGFGAYRLPSPEPGGLKTAILVQQGPGGPILAAAHD